MNTDMTLTAAGPLVTEQPGVPPALLLGYLLLAAGVLIFVVGGAVAAEESEGISGGGLLAGAVLGVVLCVIGTVVLVDASKKGDPLQVEVLDQARVSDAISDQYRVTSIEPAADGDEGEPTAAQLCGSVSPDSPEYIGVADSQQIRFKAGSMNCTSSTPDITIIVTETPGAALSADDLRKHHTTEEP